METKQQLPWKLILADLLGLMLIFFILIYALTPNNDSWKHIAKSLSAQFNPNNKNIFVERIQKESVEQVAIKNGKDMEYLYNVIYSRLDEIKSNKIRIEFNKAKNNIIISFGNRELFGDDAIVNSEGRQILSDIANILFQIDNKVIVEIDSLASDVKKDNMFMSQTTLSVARGLEIAKFLRKSGYENIGEIFAVESNEKYNITKIIIMPDKMVRS
jgi:flagellar motor protein MotB